MRWLGGTTDSMDMAFSKLRELLMDREAWLDAVPGATKSGTRLSGGAAAALNGEFSRESSQWRDGAREGDRWKERKAGTLGAPGHCPGHPSEHTGENRLQPALSEPDCPPHPLRITPTRGFPLYTNPAAQEHPQDRTVCITSNLSSASSITNHLSDTGKAQR